MAVKPAEVDDNTYSPPTLMLLFDDQRATHAVTAAPCNELAVPSLPDAPDESFAISDYSVVCGQPSHMVTSLGNSQTTDALA